MKLRFLLFVMMTAAVPLLVALIVTAKTVHVTQAGFENRITGALTMVESRLAAEGARRRELLLRLSDPQSLIGSAVRQAASRGQAPSLELTQRLRTAIAELESPTAVPEVVAVATPQGVALSITDREMRTLDVESMPLARSAFDGHRAELWALLDGDLYRFHAVPIGIAEGAFIIGDRVADATAARLREAGRADVTFVIGDTPRVSSIPILERDDVVAAAERPNSTVRTGRLSLGLIGFEFLDEIFPLFAPGEAMVSLGRSLGNQVSVVVTMRTEQEAGWVGWVQFLCILLSAGTILVGLVWSWFLVLPVNRQARSIERHLARLRVERGAQLTTRGFSAPFVTLVQTLDKFAEHLARDQAARPAPAAPASEPAEVESPEDLSQTARHLLRPPEELPLADSPITTDGDEEEGTPAAFPFGDDPALQQALAEASASLGKRGKSREADSPSDEGGASDSPDPSISSESTPSPATSAEHGQSAPREWTPAPAPSGTTDDGDEGASPVTPRPYGNLATAARGTGTFGPESPLTPPTVVDHPVVPGGAAAARYGSDGSAAFRSEPDAALAPGSSPSEEPSSAGPVPLPPPRRPEPFQTSTAAGDGTGGLPPDLLARSRELEQEFLGDDDASIDPEEAHYREVYEQFLATRRECGEKVEGLSLEKFSNRLRKNRDALVEKYGCRTVRFQVYVKEGKAAIKASPVK